MGILKRKKVCVIDDEASIREIYSVKLDLEGFEAISAANGEEGLKLMREQKPDVVLLDLQMPVKNGFDVLEEMQKDESIKSIPVIILSNINDQEAFAKVGKFETRFYVVKSLTTIQKVIDIIREVLH